MRWKRRQLRRQRTHWIRCEKTWLKEGWDAYVVHAAMIYRKHPSQVTKRERALAKEHIFGETYGLSGKKLKKLLEDPWPSIQKADPVGFKKGELAIVVGQPHNGIRKTRVLEEMVRKAGKGSKR